MKVLLFGGSGILGTELRNAYPGIIVAPRNIDIIQYVDLHTYILNTVKPDIIILAAAKTDGVAIESDPFQAVETNIIGTANVALICMRHNIRLVYISTDYVYKGDRGNYKETDEILPFNMYSWTKLGGECSVRGVKNHLIVRTSFGKEFKYKQAFSDKWTSKDYVYKIAPMIYDAAVSPLTGILNIGTERKTVYQHAHEFFPEVSPVRMESSDFSTPYDTSLNLQKWHDYLSYDRAAAPRHQCRVCGSSNLVKYLDLGLMPLANNLELTASKAKSQERFPLQVMFCEDCSLSQLSVVINPSKMFSYYTYRSSINGGYVAHCHKMAMQLQKRFNLNEDSFHIDIAGNDGALLKAFKGHIGLKVLNVDPASNLTAIAESEGIRSCNKFWSRFTADYVKTTYGEADLITATNVFAHVDDMRGFMVGASHALKQDGFLVLEFPYIVDFIENSEFDTVYFEHLSYIGISPLRRLCTDVGMTIVDVTRHDIHGGTVRVIIQNSQYATPSDRVAGFLDREDRGGFNSLHLYKMWSTGIARRISDFRGEMLSLKSQGKRIAAFAASAKGNTLLCSAGIDNNIIEYIVDETPEKIGKYSPGTGIPIVNKQRLIDSPPDYIVILSWNFKEEIIFKLKQIYSGMFIIPVPYFRITDGTEEQDQA